MVARDQKSPAAPAEPCDGRAVLAGQTVSDVDGKQPQFVEVEFIDHREHAVRT